MRVGHAIVEYRAFGTPHDHALVRHRHRETTDGVVVKDAGGLHQQGIDRTGETTEP